MRNDDVLLLLAYAEVLKEYCSNHDPFMSDCGDCIFRCYDGTSKCWLSCVPVTWNVNELQKRRTREMMNDNADNA